MPEEVVEELTEQESKDLFNAADEEFGAAQAEAEGVTPEPEDPDPDGQAEDEPEKKAAKPAEKPEGEEPTAAEKAEARAAEKAKAAREERLLAAAEKVEKGEKKDPPKQEDPEPDGEPASLEESIFEVLKDEEVEGPDGEKMTVAAIRKEYPDIYGLMSKMAAETLKRATEAVQSVEGKVSPLAETIEQQKEQAERAQMFAALADAGHEDAPEIEGMPEFQKWYKEDATDGVKALLASSDVDDIALGLAVAKEALGIESGKPASGTQEKLDKAQENKAKRDALHKTTVRNKKVAKKTEDDEELTADEAHDIFKAEATRKD